MKSLIECIRNIVNVDMNMQIAKSILNTNNNKRNRIPKSKVYEYYLIYIYFNDNKIKNKELKQKLFDKIHYHFQNRYTRDCRLSTFNSLRLEQWYVTMRYQEFVELPNKRRFNNCYKMENLLRKHSLELHRVLEPLTKKGLYEYILEVLNMIDEIKSFLNFFLT